MLWPLSWLLYKHCPGGDEDEARHQRLVEEAERRGERESGGAEGSTVPITAPNTAPTAEAMAEGHPNMEGAAVEDAIEEDSKAEDEKWAALELLVWAACKCSQRRPCSSPHRWAALELLVWAACKCSPRRPRASPLRWVALEVKKYLDKALEEKQGLRGTLLGLIAC